MLEFAEFHARLCCTLLTQMLEFVIPLGQSLDREVPVAGAIHCGHWDSLLDDGRVGESARPANLARYIDEISTGYYGTLLRTT